ncbi:MAG: glycosyltransferase, partial [Thermoplasmata archaeon]
MMFGLSPLHLLLLIYALGLTMVTLASIPLLAGFPRLPGEAGGRVEPLVSIILPVRNQGETVAGCIESLLDQDYPRKEIIVVDGGSEDDTGAILRRYETRIRLLEEPSLPEGWIGKNWACHHGFQASKGDLLLFTDGDTVHHRSLLRRAVAYMLKEELDLLTLLPRLRLESFWERVILPLMIFLIGVTNRGAWVNGQDKPWAVGNGQFLLFKREAYEAVGGHRAVRDRVDEDYRLARLVKQRGFRLHMVDARDAMDVRMYPSLREIWYGWVKNVFAGLDFSLRRTMRSTLSLFVAFILPYLLLAAALAELAVRGPTLLLPVGAFLSGLLWVRSAMAYAFLSGHARYALFAPLGALIIAAIL